MSATVGRGRREIRNRVEQLSQLFRTNWRLTSALQEAKMAWGYLDEGDELEDREYPDEPDDEALDDSTDDDLYLRCPECGADVYEDAPQCPECGHYVTSGGRTAIPVGWKLVAVLILIAFALSALAALR